MDNIFIDEFIDELGQETGAKVSNEDLFKIPAIIQILDRHIQDRTNLILKYSAKKYEPENFGKKFNEIDGYLEEYDKMLAECRAECDAVINKLKEKGEI